jgi:putative transposase
MKIRFTDEQIIAMIKEQEAGERTADVCRRHGISEGTFYKYKSKYGGMEPSDAKRLRALDRAIVRHWFEDNGEGECEAEETVGGADARSSH